MLNDRTLELLAKQSEEIISEEEIQELKETLKVRGYVELDEFVLSKIAFLNGYHRVYYDEFSSKSKEEVERATPGKWVVDSTIVYDFATNHDIISVQTGEGDFFYFNENQMKEYRKDMEVAQQKTVDELLRE